MRALQLAATCILAAILAGCDATGSPTPAPTLTARPSQPSPTSSVAVDPSLLTLLPAEVAGLAIEESPEAEAAALGDPGLAAVATAVAAGLAIDPGTGDFVYTTVVRLRAGGLGETAFRDWRDSFDDGACSQADGVTGHAETEIGGRTVYIGTCAGGLHTYHVLLAADDALVSASAAGERRLGELLVEGLQPAGG